MSYNRLIFTSWFYNVANEFLWTENWKCQYSYSPYILYKNKCKCNTRISVWRRGWKKTNKKLPDSHIPFAVLQAPCWQYLYTVFNKALMLLDHKNNNYYKDNKGQLAPPPPSNPGMRKDWKERKDGIRTHCRSHWFLLDYLPSLILRKFCTNSFVHGRLGRRSLTPFFFLTHFV